MNNLSLNFHAKLRDKKSNSILIELYKFINTTFNEILEKVNDISELSIVVQDKVSHFAKDFARIWKVEFTVNKLAYIEICDGFEGLIMKSVNLQVLSYMGNDEKLHKVYRKYSFLNLKHFGIEFLVDEFELAGQIKSKSLIY